MDAVTFYYPVYRFAGLLKLITALVSCATVITLAPTIPKFLSMPSPEALQHEIDEKQRAEEALRKLAEELEERVLERTRQLEESQRDLSEKNKQLNTVLESIGEGLVMIDRSGKFVLKNPAAMEIMTALQEPPESRENWDVFGLTNEDGEHIPTSELPIIRALDGESVSGAILGLVQNGEQRWLRVSANPLAQGSDGAVAVFHDVTELRQALNSAKLEKERAEMAMRSRTEFLAVMSHELRTPINGIQGMLELLEDTNLDHKQVELTDVARSCSDTLLSLIDHILDLSKLDAGNLELAKKPFSLPEVCKSMENVFLARLSETLSLQIEFTTDIPDWVLGDRKRLLQILINLIGNAVKYAKQGTITLSVSYSLGTATISVSDEGPGIDEELAPKLFEPFSRGSAASSGTESGVGLGLAIVRRLVHALHGTIRLDEHYNEGARFLLELPLPETEPPADNNSNLVPKHVFKKTILVVEDNPVNRRVALMLLEKLGFANTLHAADGEAALLTTEKEKPDIILMDFRMPNMDGPTATENIKKSPEKYGEPIIIALTAQALEEDRRRCMEAGMDGFLSKPFTSEQLLKVLARLVS